MSPKRTPHQVIDTPTYRMYTADVARTERLGPSFVRVTFTGDDLAEFGVGGDDQRIKLMLPQPGRTVADVPCGAGWYDAWRAMPEAIRPTMRTYTVRAFRPTAAELDVDVVLHGGAEVPAGPVSSWAASARPGDRVALLGPDRPGRGRMWGCEWAPPTHARRVLLAGDETAVPAIGAIIEALPRARRGVVCVEVPEAGDVQHWDAPSGVEVRWLVRSDGPDHVAHGALLETAVTGELDRPSRPTPRPVTDDVDDVDDVDDLADIDIEHAVLWDVPGVEGSTGAGDMYAWIAGEAGVIKRLRRLMVNDYGVPRSSVAFMGYWRQGRSELP